MENCFYGIKKSKKITAAKAMLIFSIVYTVVYGLIVLFTTSSNSELMSNFMHNCVLLFPFIGTIMLLVFMKKQRYLEEMTSGLNLFVINILAFGFSSYRIQLYRHNEFFIKLIIASIVMLIVIAFIIKEFSQLIEGHFNSVKMYILFALLGAGFLLFGDFKRDIPHILLVVSYVLIFSSMSKETDAEYITKPELVSSSDPTKRIRKIKRKSIGGNIVFSIITFGMYFYIVWLFNIVKDVKKVCDEKGTGIGTAWLIICIPFYKWYWLISTGKKLRVVTTNNKVLQTGNAAGYFFAEIFLPSFVPMALIQSTLNTLADRIDENFVSGTVYIENTTPIQKVFSENNGSITNELKEIKELLDSGAITQEEYDNLKAKILYK